MYWFLTSVVFLVNRKTMSWNLFGVHQYMWLFRFWGGGAYMPYMHATPIFSQKNRPIGYQVHKKIATPTKFYQIWCSMLKLQLPIYKSCTKTKSCGILFQQFFWHNVRKKCSNVWVWLLKFEDEGWEFSIFLRLLDHFIQAVKG